MIHSDCLPCTMRRSGETVWVPARARKTGFPSRGDFCAKSPPKHKCRAPVHVSTRAVFFPVGVLVKGCIVILVKGTQSKQLHEAIPSNVKDVFPWQHYDPNDMTVPSQPWRQRHLCMIIIFEMQYRYFGLVLSKG